MIWEISEMTSAASSRPSIWVMHATRLQMQLRYEKKNMVPIRQLSHCVGTDAAGQLPLVSEQGYCRRPHSRLPPCCIREACSEASVSMVTS